MSESFYPLDRLTSLLRWVRGFPQQIRFEATGATPFDASPFHRIRYCSDALLQGALPDAETLEFVALAFYKYVYSGGTLSLDEAFGLRSKPKAGNPARQFDRNNKMKVLLFEMARMRALSPKMTLKKAAETALQGDESIQVETLERNYRQLGIKKIEVAMRGK